MIRRLLEQYRGGERKPADVIAEAFSKIGSHHPVWISLADRDRAIERAASLQDRNLPLYGVPFAVKDNIDVAGMVTTAGCPAFGYQAGKTATVVERLEAAGGVLIGKTNLDQFATGLVGVRSPYGACSSVFDSRYISGGSSSGSAVAVASGQVAFALGTDTAGSGRVPAAFNELVGLKPARGAWSTAGVVPACRTLDCVTVLTRDAGDAELVDAVARGFDEADPYSRLPRTGQTAAPWLAGKVRFGVPREGQLQFFGDGEAAKLYFDAIEALRDTGGEPVEIDYEPFRAAAQLLYAGPWVAERVSAAGRFLETNAADIHPTVRRILEGGRRYTAVNAFEAAYQLAALRRASEAQWARMDVLLLPTTGTTYTIREVEANPIELNSNLGYYTNFVNLLDLSAIAIPAGRRPNGLPFGVTLIGKAFQDAGLVALAKRMSAQRTAETPGCIQVAVVGAHLSGQPLNHQLTSRGARLLRTTKTAPEYRLYALRNTTPPKPGLVREPGFAGPGIEIEIWAMPEDRFGSFVAEVPAPLGIGNATMAAGENVKCFVCEPYAVAGSEEITKWGGWRAWLASRSNQK